MATESKVKVLDKALDILECFSESKQELSLTELADLTQQSPSTAYRIIKTLESRHFLIRHENKKFSLGLKLMYLGSLGTGSAIERLKNLALPIMSKLREEVNESISIYIREGNKRICITRLESTNSLRQVIRIGDKYDINQGATGKILLAYEPKTTQQTILLDDFPQWEKTIQQVQHDGYAISSSERAEGVSAIAVPILGVNNTILAALSLSGPTNRLLDKDLQSKIAAVIHFGQEISNAIQNESNIDNK